MARDLARSILRLQRYTVFEAGDGGQAAESHDGPLHLLHTDAVIPDTGGNRLQRYRPELLVGLSCQH